jgi:hypothetical protein
MRLDLPELLIGRGEFIFAVEVVHHVLWQVVDSRQIFLHRDIKMPPATNPTTAVLVPSS